MQSDKEKLKKEFIARLIRFTVDFINLARKIREVDKNLWTLVDQPIRSAGSIGANVVEAKAVSSKRDYLKYFKLP